MKQISRIFSVLAFTLVLNAGAKAQGQKAQKAVISLPTIACDKCKEVIENSVWKQVDGVQFIEVNVKRKNAKVTYLPDRIDLPNLRLFIADLGFDADDEKADPEAIKKLPKECKAHLLAPPAPQPNKAPVSDTARRKG